MRRLLFLAPLVLLGGSLGAQDDARALDRRLVAALSARDAAARAITAYRAKQPKASYPDTFVIAGTPLRIVSTPAASSIGRDAGAIVGRRLTQRFGEGTHLMEPTTFYLEKDSSEYGAFAKSGQLRGSDQVLNREAPWKADALADAFEMQAQQALVARMDSTLRYQMAGSLPVDGITDGQWAEIRAVLATSYSTAAKRCLEQDVVACERVLRVVPVADQATELFDSVGRRATVAQTNFWNPVNRAEQQECLGGNDDYCLMILRRDRSNLVLGGQGIATLAGQAYAMGGDGALDRLLKARGSIPEILQTTAKQPLDTIVGRWARNVRDRGSASAAFSVTIALVAIAWSVFLLFLAMRSSRWR